MEILMFPLWLPMMSLLYSSWWVLRILHLSWIILLLLTVASLVPTNQPSLLRFPWHSGSFLYIDCSVCSTSMLPAMTCSQGDKCLQRASFCASLEPQVWSPRRSPFPPLANAWLSCTAWCPVSDHCSLHITRFCFVCCFKWQEKPYLIALVWPEA